MANEILIYIGSAIIILWGIAHILSKRAIVKGFGEISEDNKKILAMEVTAEGVTLIFLGVLPLIITLFGNSQNYEAHVVYFLAALVLLAMGLITLLTGARTPVVWYKICVAVKVLTAALYLAGFAL